MLRPRTTTMTTRMNAAAAIDRSAQWIVPRYQLRCGRSASVRRDSSTHARTSRHFASPPPVDRGERNAAARVCAQPTGSRPARLGEGAISEALAQDRRRAVLSRARRRRLADTVRSNSNAAVAVFVCAKARPASWPGQARCDTHTCCRRLGASECCARRRAQPATVGSRRATG
jgi:hypothetical protein